MTSYLFINPEASEITRDRSKSIREALEDLRTIDQQLPFYVLTILLEKELELRK